MRVISEHYGHRVGSSNYDNLVNSAMYYSTAMEEDVCFVTFNYDTLLEISINRIARHDINSIGKYIHGSRLKVIKPHGSCNWGRRINMVYRYKNVSIDIARHIYDDRIKYDDIVENLEDDITVHKKWSDRTFVGEGIDFKAYFPQLPLPVKTKDDFILPVDHYQYLVSVLPKVTDVLIIGWKGAEMEFRKLIENTINIH
jgi:hypothetical protein